jgi:hypothetical protein
VISVKTSSTAKMFRTLFAFALAVAARCTLSSVATMGEASILKKVINLSSQRDGSSYHRIH